MQINQSQLSISSFSLNIKGEIKDNQSSGKDDTDSNGKVSAKDISNTYLFEYNLEIKTIAYSSSTTQGMSVNLDKVKELLKKIDVASTGYSGKNIEDLSTDEAKSLVSEDGFFGIKQTSKRLSDFVINGGGTDLARLKAGREGMLRGFKEAEDLWGEKLPDIAYQTIKQATEAVDKFIESLGGQALDAKA